jgi:hydroxyacylglutathione hydrolase
VRRHGQHRPDATASRRDHSGDAAAAELLPDLVHEDDEGRLHRSRRRPRPAEGGGAKQHGVEVEKILLTHGHIDHCGSAKMLADELGVKIEGPHEDDRFWIARLEDDGRNYGITGKSFEIDRWLVNGDQVTVGELVLDVYHCPGHTPGHVVFHHPQSKLAIVGDVLFQGSIGRTDFPMGNHQDLLDAITGRLWPLGDDTAFVPGHGPMSTFGQERRTNPFVADRVLQRA